MPRTNPTEKKRCPKCEVYFSSSNFAKHTKTCTSSPARQHTLLSLGCAAAAREAAAQLEVHDPIEDDEEEDEDEGGETDEDEDEEGDWGEDADEENGRSPKRQRDEQTLTAARPAALLLQSIIATLSLLMSKVISLPKAVADLLPDAIAKNDDATRAREAAARDGPTLSARLQHCRSVAELAQVPDAGLRADYRDGFLVCVDCELYLLPRTGRGVGVFALNQRFTDVKSNVISHLESRTHADAARAAALSRKMLSLNETAGLNCARRVLQVVLEHLSYLAYERLIATAAAEGVEVGTLNHSAAFPRQFVPSMHAMIIEGVQHLLETPDPATGRPPAFALIADKATNARQTGQMIGIIVMVKGIKIPIFLSVAVVRAALAENATTTLAPGSGRNLAIHLLEALVRSKPLKLQMPRVREQLTSLGLDGQYLGTEEGNDSGLDVPRHLCELLEIDADFVRAWWDGAHMIELGSDDTRKNPLVAWWPEMAVVVSGTQSKYLYGKAYDRIWLAAVREFHSIAIDDLRAVDQAGQQPAGEISEAAANGAAAGETAAPNLMRGHLGRSILSRSAGG